MLALEIVEHVADVDLFLRSCGRMVKPGGLLFLSTLNRTAKAWVLAIAGAEYVLGWLPRGTHDWKKFLKPSEVVSGLRSGGIEAQEIVGVVYSPLSRAWSLNKSDLDVNYMLYGNPCPERADRRWRSRGTCSRIGYRGGRSLTRLPLRSGDNSRGIGRRPNSMPSSASASASSSLVSP